MFEFREKNTVIGHVLTAVCILILAVLQTTLVRAIEVFDVIPNLLFITVVCYGLLHGDYKSLIVGAACGLILDILGGRAVGLNTLLCTYVAFFCLSISGNLFNNNAFVSMVFVFFLTIPYEFLTYLFYFVIWGKGAWLYAIFHKILPAALYNALLTVLIYPIVRRISDSV